MAQVKVLQVCDSVMGGQKPWGSRSCLKPAVRLPGAQPEGAMPRPGAGWLTRQHVSWEKSSTVLEKARRWRVHGDSREERSLQTCCKQKIITPATFVPIKHHCATPSMQVYVSKIDLVTAYARLRLAPNPSLAIILFTFHSLWVQQAANFQVSLAPAPQCLCPRAQSSPSAVHSSCTATPGEACLAPALAPRHSISEK